jgi:hypothetical protein
MDVRYTPQTIAELRTLLYGCPNLMKVEVEEGNREDRRRSSQAHHWSSEWTLAIPLGRDPWHAIRVERRMVASNGRAPGPP